MTSISIASSPSCSTAADDDDDDQEPFLPVTASGGSGDSYGGSEEDEAESTINQEKDTATWATSAAINLIMEMDYNMIQSIEASYELELKMFNYTDRFSLFSIS